MQGSRRKNRHDLSHGAGEVLESNLCDFVFDAHVQRVWILSTVGGGVRLSSSHVQAKTWERRTEAPEGSYVEQLLTALKPVAHTSH